MNWTGESHRWCLPLGDEKTAPWPSSKTSLTLQAVSVQKLLAFLVHLDPALRTAHTLPSDAPQQTLALVAVSGRGGGPHLKIVWRGAGDGVDESLQSFLVYMVFLLEQKRWAGFNDSEVFRKWRKGFFSVFLGHCRRKLGFYIVAKQSSELREENAEEKLRKTGQTLLSVFVSAAVFYQVILMFN